MSAAERGVPHLDLPGMEPVEDLAPAGGREPAEDGGPAGHRFPVPGSPVPGSRFPVPGSAPGPVPGSRFPGGPEPGTGPGGEPAGPPEPDGRIGFAAAAWLSFRAWMRHAGESQKKHHGFWRWIRYQVADKAPESLTEVRRHFASRSWLKNYMQGPVRAFCEWENVWFGRIISYPATSVGNSFIRICQRQSRFWAAALIIILIFVIHYLGH